jgi:hypothetical protein
MLTRAYQISDRPGATLYVGYMKGRVRPSMWMTMEPHGDHPAVLASFHGDREAVAAANFLDTLVGQLQRVIDHLAGEHDAG